MIASDVRDFPYYDGTGDVNFLLDIFGEEVPKEQRFQALDVILRSTPNRWWGTLKGNIRSWRKYNRFRQIIFGKVNARLAGKYDGKDDLR